MVLNALVLEDALIRVSGTNIGPSADIGVDIGQTLTSQDKLYMSDSQDKCQKIKFQRIGGLTPRPLFTLWAIIPVAGTIYHSYQQI